MKAVGLIDCNNFFVSCERIFRPDLFNRPVVVLSSNDGCVVARSQEIKDMGITMAVPYFQIKDKLKEVGAEVFSSNFELYRDISSRVFKIVKSELEDSEQYSIDECFFGLNDSNNQEQIFNLKQRVFDEIGIPVSVGVGPSKTIAKYANKIAKKTNEVTYISDSEWLKLASSIRLSELWGVGVGRFREFASHNIETALDLILLEDREVQKLFGLEGLRLKLELSGKYIPFKLKDPLTLKKSITSTRSFAETIKDKALITNALFNHVNKLVSELYASNLKASTIRIMVYPSHHGDYFLQGFSLEEVCMKPTRDIFILEQIVLGLLNKGYKAGVPYKKAGVLLTGLVPADIVQQSLFAEDNRTENVTGTMIELNNKLGKSIIKLGLVTSAKGDYSRHNNISPRYTTDWSDLRKVSAKS